MSTQNFVTSVVSKSIWKPKAADDCRFTTICDSKPKLRSMKFKLIFSFVFVLLLLSGYNGVFCINSFNKLYSQRLLSGYQLIIEGIIDDIQKLDDDTLHPSAVADLSRHWNEHLRALTHSIAPASSQTDAVIAYYFSIIDPKGRSRYVSNPSWNASNRGQWMTQRMGSTGSLKELGQDWHYDEDEAMIHLAAKVRNGDGDWMSTVMLSIDKTTLSIFHKDVFKSALNAALIVFSAGTLAMLFAMGRISSRKYRAKALPKTRIGLIVCIIFGLSQLLTIGLNGYYFHASIQDLAHKKTAILANQFKNKFDEALHRSSSRDQSKHLTKIVSNHLQYVPDLDQIVFYDKEARPTYLISADGLQKVEDLNVRQKHALIEALIASSPNYSLVDKFAREDGVDGFALRSVSKYKISGSLKHIFLNTLTSVGISFLFLVEIVILIFNTYQTQSSRQDRVRRINYSNMRPAAFFFLFGIDISMSFLPLHMENLKESFLGLSNEMIMGLPISTEFFFVGWAIFASGVWIDRRGWHEPFITGLTLAASGVLYSWLAPDALQFILSRAVVGTGYGLTLMACQGFVITYSDDRSKAQGLAHLFAGIYSGSLCGGATGAILAELFGYKMVFAVGAAVLASVIIYTILFMRHAFEKPEFSPANPVKPGSLVNPAASKETRPYKIWRFLTNRNVVGLMLFSSLPASIAVIGFLNYFSPIYLNRAGVSQATIGRVLMIYGICLIYVGPFISRYVDASNRKKAFIFLGCILGSGAFLIFRFFDGLMAASVAVLLLGLSNSLVLAAQSAFALRLRVTQELGAGKAIGIFRSTSRLGQVTGPVIFSWLIAATNLKEGATYLGLAYLLTAMLFYLLTSEKKESINA